MTSAGVELSEVFQVLAEQMAKTLKLTLCPIALLDEGRAHLRSRAMCPVRQVAWGIGLGSRIALAEAPSSHRAITHRESAARPEALDSSAGKLAPVVP